MKPGYKTTEFWLSAAATAVGMVYASGVLETADSGWGEKIVGIVAAVLASMGYSVSRGLAKKS